MLTFVRKRFTYTWAVARACCRVFIRFPSLISSAPVSTHYPNSLTHYYSSSSDRRTLVYVDVDQPVVGQRILRNEGPVCLVQRCPRLRQLLTVKQPEPPLRRGPVVGRHASSASASHSSTLSLSLSSILFLSLFSILFPFSVVVFVLIRVMTKLGK